MEETTNTAIDPIAAKVEELSKTYKKVTPITIDADGEEITGYFKDANADLLLYCMDCMGSKETSKGGEAMLRYCLIPEASDPRIMNKDEYPVIYASFVTHAFKMYKFHTAKKK